MVPSQTATIRPRGFTVLEVVIVIAITGMLTGIVVGSLFLARLNSVDITVKGKLSTLRTQAERYYSEHGKTYAGICGTTGTDVIGDDILSSAVTVGLTTFIHNGAGNIQNAVCNDTASGVVDSYWSAQVKLKKGGVFCIDSTGIAVYSAVPLINNASDFSCAS